MHHCAGDSGHQRGACGSLRGRVDRARGHGGVCPGRRGRELPAHHGRRDHRAAGPAGKMRGTAGREMAFARMESGTRAWISLQALRFTIYPQRLRTRLDASYEQSIPSCTGPPRSPCFSSHVVKFAAAGGRDAGGGAVLDGAVDARELRDLGGAGRHHARGAPRCAQGAHR